MDVFIIHSGADEDIVQKRLSEIKGKVYSFNPLLLSTREKRKPSKVQFWKLNARKKIKRAQIVVFFVGEKSHESRYIDWELGTAMKYGKPIYTVKLDSSYRINDILMLEDRFSRDKRAYSRDYEFPQLLKLLDNHEKGQYEIFNKDVADPNRTILLEQYKIFLQTSEDLVSRRQNVNNFYITINSALLTAYGVIWALSIASLYKFITGLLLSAVGIILSVSWIKILASYGNLNSSKMKIISHIEKELPASLYDAEWSVLSDSLNKKKYVSFTESEKRVPLLFIAVYIAVALSGIAFLFC